MKKKKSRKLQLQRLSIRKLDAAQGGAAYMSYHKWCSNSCNSCGNGQGMGGGGCEVIGPSDGPNLCSHQY